MTGTTLSSDFPVTDNAIFKTYNGCVGCDQYSWGDSYFLIMNPDGNKLEYATYLGGANDEEAYDIARDKTGAIYLTGSTNSSTFPTTKGAFQQIKSNSLDVYVTKFAFDELSYISEVSSNEITIEPYVNDTFTVSLGSTQSLHVKIDVFGIQGNLIQSKSFCNTNTPTFNLTNYPTGMYLIKIVADGKNYSAKISKD
jgi:hypothetical protein